jgi:hypothetical protein
MFYRTQPTSAWFTGDCLMSTTLHNTTKLNPSTEALYRRTLQVMVDSEIPFMLGGAYALAQYMEFERHTRDLDLFCRRSDAELALDVLNKAGFKTEMLFPHWLGKAFAGEEYIDIIFSSGNGIAEVDDECFAQAHEAKVLGIDVKVLPADYIIWSKAFIMERERFDGADIAHLLRACADSLNWKRLLGRFQDDWRVLLSHLILFGFIYPGERNKVPDWVFNDLLGRLNAELDEKPNPEKLCKGTLLSRAQYLVDVDHWGYADVRQQPIGNMSAADIAHWTAAIEK